MKKLYLKKSWGLIFIILIITTMLSATKNELDASKLGIGAVSMGRGGWYVANSGGADAGLLNPAGLASVASLKVTSMYTSLMQEFNYIVASGVMPVDNLGVFSLSYLGLSTDGDVKRNEVGTAGSSLDYADSIFSLGYGKKLLNNLDLGVKCKYFIKKFGDISSGNASGYGIDLGLNYQLNNWAKLGLVYQNILGELTWDSDTVGRLYSGLRAGAELALIGEGSPYQLDQQKLLVGMDLDLSSGQSYKPATLFSLGLEYLPINYLALRMGIDQTLERRDLVSNFTMGLGLNYESFSFDYAYHPYHEISDNDSHYFSFSYNPQTTKAKVVEPIKVVPPVPVVETKSYFELVNYKNSLVEKEVLIEGLVYGTKIAKIFVNSNLANIDEDQQFSVIIPLNIGKNELEIIAVDESGLQVQAEMKKLVRLTDFTDVIDTGLAATAIRELATIGMINGYDDGSFKPEDKITRGEITALLVKAKKLKLGEASVLFNDVKLNNWTNKYILRAVDTDLIKGYIDGTFKPGATITRAEAITLLIRFDGIQKAEVADTVIYQDVLLNNWAINNINLAKRKGMLDYISGNFLDPNRELTRAEAIEMLSKTDYIKRAIHDLYK